MTTCKHYASAALQAQYGGQGCTTIQPATIVKPESNLPFTGFDLGFFLLLAGILIATGFVLRRAGRKS